jgi:hypothetical protein
MPAQPKPAKASLQLDHIERFEPFVRLGNFELDPVALVERFEAFAADDGEMNENILSTFILGNEAKALLVVEPLDDSMSHEFVP